jgi:hypothetical protein
MKMPAMAGDPSIALGRLRQLASPSGAESEGSQTSTVPGCTLSNCLASGGYMVAGELGELAINGLAVIFEIGVRR